MLQVLPAKFDDKFEGVTRYGGAKLGGVVFDFATINLGNGAK